MASLHTPSKSQLVHTLPPDYCSPKPLTILTFSGQGLQCSYMTMRTERLQGRMAILVAQRLTLIYLDILQPSSDNLPCNQHTSQNASDQQLMVICQC